MATRIELVPQMGPPYRGDAAMLGDTVLAIGTGAVCCQAARVLQQMDHTGRVEFWRGDTLCLSGPIEAFAALTVEEGNRPPRFKAYTPFEWPTGVAGEPAGASDPSTLADVA